MKEINELLEKFEISDFKKFLNFFISDIYTPKITKSDFFNFMFYHNKKEENVLSSNYVEKNRIPFNNDFSGYISQYNSYNNENSKINFTIKPDNKTKTNKSIFFQIEWKDTKIQMLKMFLTLNDIDLVLEIKSSNKYISNLFFEFNNKNKFLLTTTFKADAESKIKPQYTYSQIKNETQQSIEVFKRITQIMEGNAPLLTEDLDMLNLILDDNESHTFFKNLVQSGFIPELVKQINLLCFNANKDRKNNFKKNRTL